MVRPRHMRRCQVMRCSRRKNDVDVRVPLTRRRSYGDPINWSRHSNVGHNRSDRVWRLQKFDRLFTVPGL